MPLTQEQVTPKFHAIECRVNAEDPVTFAPSPGNITGYHPPGGYGVRVDSAAYENYRVLPHYDSLRGQAHLLRATRARWRSRAHAAGARRVRDRGHPTNIPFHCAGVLADGASWRGSTTPGSWSRS